MHLKVAKTASMAEKKKFITEEPKFEVGLGNNAVIVD